MGTPAYMSPEQADGAAGRMPAPIVYSLGVRAVRDAGRRAALHRARPRMAIVAKRFTEPVPERAGRAARGAGVGGPGHSARARARRRGPVRHDGRVRQDAAAGRRQDPHAAPTPAATPAPAATGVAALLAAAVALGLVVLVAVSILAGEHRRAGERGRRRCSPSSRSRTSATRPTPTSPTGRQRACASSSRSSTGLEVIARAQLQPVPAARRRRRRRSPASWARDYLLTVHRAMGQDAGGREPGPGESRAGRCRRRACAARRAGSSRSTPRSPTSSSRAGRHRGPGGRRARRRARRQRPARAGAQADAESRGLRRLPPGRGGGAGDEGGQRGAPAGDRVLRAGGLPRYGIRAGVEAALAARTSLYSNGVPDPSLAEAARTAEEQARALRPDDPLVYLAAGELYSSVNPIDNSRALAEYERGLRLAPDDADLLGAAALIEAWLGRWDELGPAARARGAVGSALARASAPAGHGAHLPPPVRRR